MDYSPVGTKELTQLNNLLRDTHSRGGSEEKKAPGKLVSTSIVANCRADGAPQGLGHQNQRWPIMGQTGASCEAHCSCPPRPSSRPDLTGYKGCPFTHFRHLTSNKPIPAWLCSREQLGLGCCSESL